MNPEMKMKITQFNQLNKNEQQTELKRQLGEENVHDIYSEEEISIPAKTVKYIKLVEPNNSLNSKKNLVIISNQEFQAKKMLITNPVCLARIDNMVVEHRTHLHFHTEFKFF